MGYFDGLTSASFNTNQNGRPLFFPWGVLGSGSRRSKTISGCDSR